MEQSSAWQVRQLHERHDADMKAGRITAVPYIGREPMGGLADFGQAENSPNRIPKFYVDMSDGFRRQFDTVEQAQAFIDEHSPKEAT